MPACLIPDPCAHTPRGSEEGNRHSPTGVEILTGVTGRSQYLARTYDHLTGTGEAAFLRRARTLGMV